MDKIPKISEDLNQAVTSVKNITSKLENGEGTLSKLINNEEFYNNVNGLVTDSRGLVNDIKDNPTKYLRAYFEAKKK